MPAGNKEGGYLNEKEWLNSVYSSHLYKLWRNRGISVNKKRIIVPKFITARSSWHPRFVKPINGCDYPGIIIRITLLDELEQSCGCIRKHFILASRDIEHYRTGIHRTISAITDFYFLPVFPFAIVFIPIRLARHTRKFIHQQSQSGPSRGAKPCSLLSRSAFAWFHRQSAPFAPPTSVRWNFLIWQILNLWLN